MNNNVAVNNAINIINELIPLVEKQNLNLKVRGTGVLLMYLAAELL